MVFFRSAICTHNFFCAMGKIIRRLESGTIYCEYTNTFKTVVERKNNKRSIFAIRVTLRRLNLLNLKMSLSLELNFKIQIIFHSFIKKAAITIFQT